MTTFLHLNFFFPKEFEHFSYILYLTSPQGTFLRQPSFRVDSKGFVRIPVDENIASYFPYKMVLRNGFRNAGEIFIRDKDELQKFASETEQRFISYRMLEMGKIIRDEHPFNSEISKINDLESANSNLIQPESQANIILPTNKEQIMKTTEGQNDLTLEPTIISKPSSILKTTTKEIRGRIIDKAGNGLKNKTFVLYAKQQEATNLKSSGEIQTSRDAANYQALLTGITDNLGSFHVNVPNSTFLDAFLTIGEAVDYPIVIHLNSDGSLPGIILAVSEIFSDELDPSQDEDDCSCTESTDRLPDMEDLTDPMSKYQQDIGGACTNFTVPNRALEEFSFYKIVRTTDPEVVAQHILFQVEVLNEQIRNLRSALLNMQRYKEQIFFDDVVGDGFKSANEADVKLKSRFSGDIANQQTTPMHNSSQALDAQIQQLELQIFDLEGKRNSLYRGASGRNELGMYHSIDWDDTPTTFQATNISHGHILEFRQVWRADGYSMGDLLYSLPLAPGQKKQIAIFDWDRKEMASRSESQTQEEQLQNSLSRDRDVSEVVSSVFREEIDASSESASNSTTKSVSATVGTPPVSPVSASVTAGISNTKTTGNSSSNQQSSRDLSANSMQQLRDKTMQAASAVRSQRSTVVQSMEQSESMGVTTESVANYNHCHAITIQYFEVLRHFALTTELANVQECLFIPLPITPFDNSKVMRWREILVKAVGNRAVIKGFDAVARAEQARIEGANSTAYSDLPTGNFADDNITYLDISLQLRCYIARPNEIYPQNMPDIQTLTATPNASVFTGINPAELLRQVQNEALINNSDDINNWRQSIGFIPGWEGHKR